jgi:hypothetical protein
LDGLLDAGRRARPSEIVNLTKQRIVLDADTPYIRVEADGRLLKTDHKRRRAG